ncbi:unnamed protein product [Euphydryas editha]|uniref:Uncharacterized protein n=1 Tax=Euphydryas editha TaxID=104508 RepID=A0AAU9U5F1_EUPED|nr:unnamed protein product [Euphydryas editha]
MHWSASSRLIPPRTIGQLIDSCRGRAAGAVPVQRGAAGDGGGRGAAARDVHTHPVPVLPTRNILTV